MGWLKKISKIAATDDGGLRMSLVPSSATDWFSIPPEPKKRKTNVHKKRRKQNRKSNDQQ